VGLPAALDPVRISLGEAGFGSVRATPATFFPGRNRGRGVEARGVPAPSARGGAAACSSARSGRGSIGSRGASRIPWTRGCARRVSVRDEDEETPGPGLESRSLAPPSAVVPPSSENSCGGSRDCRERSRTSFSQCSGGSLRAGSGQCDGGDSGGPAESPGPAASSRPITRRRASSNPPDSESRSRARPPSTTTASFLQTISPA
jgi:hypothetical protein